MLSANILRTGTRHLSRLSRHPQGREAGGCYRGVCSIAETASLCLPTAPQNLRVCFLLQLNHNFSGGIRSSTWSTYIQRPSKPCNSYRIDESMFPLALQAECGADRARVLCKSDSSLLWLLHAPLAYASCHGNLGRSCSLSWVVYTNLCTHQSEKLCTSHESIKSWSCSSFVIELLSIRDEAVNLAWQAILLLLSIRLSSFRNRQKIAYDQRGSRSR